MRKGKAVESPCMERSALHSCGSNSSPRVLHLGEVASELHVVVNLWFWEGRDGRSHQVLLIAAVIQGETFYYRGFYSEGPAG